MIAFAPKESFHHNEIHFLLIPTITTPTMIQEGKAHDVQVQEWKPMTYQSWFERRNHCS
jgi:hypothetical protein